jgi:hypothetical protein
MKMKRQLTFRIIIATCFVALMAISLTACNDGILTFDLNGITLVEMTNGSDGAIVSITDVDHLAKLTQSFNDNEFLRGDSAKNHTDWGYRFRFMNGDSLQAEIFINTDNIIIYNNRFYHSPLGAIDFRFYNELLSETDDNF